MREIAVIGSLNMDLVGCVSNMPKVGETIIGDSFQEIPGGKGANQAVAIARLSAKVNMIGKVGDDGFGRTLLESLKKDGINIDSVQIEENTPTGVAMITVDKEGDNAIVVIPGANFKLEKEDIEKHIEVIEKSEIVLLQLEIPVDTVKYTLKRAKELGKYTILNPAPAKLLDKETIKNVDLLIPNETELEILAQIEIKEEEDILKGAKILIKEGVKSLIVTMGEKGSLYVDENCVKKFDSHKVNAVDTTAAGDSFIGGICVSLAEGKKIDDAIKFASKVGALTVTKKGAQSSLPYLEEVMSFKEA
ncbi:ribokinase [Crassaminicella thermophila]|uniref:Ribokinase n=1 Tax=Crassaminicella thermophila TaxID=2599308 RepID=A0A5C0SBV9_CRATE|nr:ribokinase [Crassaminicella thermophila]QEK10988.1 ribokinase [Crassaminicella thermophila]